jgi:hypothetical protein
MAVSGGVPKKEKGKILDEFTKVTGHHRKAAIRLIRRGNISPEETKGVVVAGGTTLRWLAH